MTVTDRGVVAFELERFAAAGRRLEVSGRWRGVRGRRFVRPTLTAEVDGGSMRALAELEHKPWAPEEDREWRAAFDWSGRWRGIEQFELAVAPDIAVRLPAPVRGGSREALNDDGEELVLEAVPAPENGRSRPHVSEREGARSSRRHDDTAAELKAAFAARNEAIEERDAAIAERDRLTAEYERLMDESSRLMGRRDLLAAQRDVTVDELAAAVQERDHALSELAAVIQERDDAVSELAETMPTRERAAGELGTAIRERDYAVTELETAVRERDDAVSELETAVRERDDALSERATAGRERDHAVAAEQRVAGELRDLRDQLDRARRELSAQPPPPIPAAPAAPARVVRPFAAGERWRTRAERTHLATRLLALAALVAFVIVLLMIITSR